MTELRIPPREWSLLQNHQALPGDRWAVYQNQVLDSASAGGFCFLLCGPSRTHKIPPAQAPDGEHGLGWKFRFIGYANTETGMVEARPPYDPDDRLAICPEENLIKVSSIEIEFAIGTVMTQDQQRRLHELLDDIVRAPWNQPMEGTHWVSGSGSKPKFSQHDARFLGKTPDPTAPLTGEPEFDDSVLHFETTARGFVAERERDKVMNKRRNEGYVVPDDLKK